MRIERRGSVRAFRYPLLEAVLSRITRRPFRQRVPFVVSTVIPWIQARTPPA